MRPVPFILLSLLLVAVAAAGDPLPAEGVDPIPPAPDRPAAGPRLALGAGSHDFGPREKNVELVWDALLANHGDAPLEILRVDTCCGLRATLAAPDPLPPGGHVRLRLQMSSGVVPGSRVKTVRIVTNDPEHPSSEYAVSCRVLADALADPFVVQVRAARSAGAVEARFDLLDLTPDGSLEIVAVETSHPGLTAKVQPLDGDPARRGYRVLLELGEDLGTGALAQRVVVRTNSRRDPRVVVEVVGALHQTVLVVPERLYFPRLEPGRQLLRRAFLNRPDGAPLTVLGVEDPTGLLEVETRRIDPSRWEIRARASGELPDRTIRGVLSIRTDAAGEPVLLLPFEIAGNE